MKIEREIKGVAIIGGGTALLPLWRDCESPPNFNHILYYKGGKFRITEKTQGVLMKSVSRLCHIAVECLDKNIPLVGGISIEPALREKVKIKWDKVEYRAEKIVRRRK